MKWKFRPVGDGSTKPGLPFTLPSWTVFAALLLSPAADPRMFFRSVAPWLLGKT